MKGNLLGTFKYAGANSASRKPLHHRSLEAAGLKWGCVTVHLPLFIHFLRHLLLASAGGKVVGGMDLWSMWCLVMSTKSSFWLKGENILLELEQQFAHPSE